jgi:hypothetical protein
MSSEQKVSSRGLVFGKSNGVDQEFLHVGRVGVKRQRTSQREPYHDHNGFRVFQQFRNEPFS